MDQADSQDSQDSLETTVKVAENAGDLVRPDDEPQPRGKGGRPPKHFTTPVMMEIIERVANGETLTAICKSDGMPTPVTFRRWIVNNPTLQAAWNTAKELRAHAYFDRVVDIAVRLEQGGWGKDASAMVRALTEAMNSLKWAAGRLSPQNYGERAPVMPVVPMIIKTTLNLGQDGAVKVTSHDDRPGEYRLKAVLPIDAIETPHGSASASIDGPSSPTAQPSATSQD